MKSQVERQRAFDLFLEGKTQHQIAATLGVTRSTIERWSQQDQWRRVKAESLSKIIRERADQMFQTKIPELDGAAQVKDLFAQAVAEHRLFCEGKITHKDRKFSLKDIRELSSAYVRANNEWWEILESVEHRQTQRRNKKMNEQDQKLSEEDSIKTREAILKQLEVM